MDKIGSITAKITGIEYTPFLCRTLHTFKLEEPFFVLATQNPIEQEGSLALDQTVFVNGELKTISLWVKLT